MLEDTDNLIQELELQNELVRRNASSHLFDFVKYRVPSYFFNWHHETMISILEHVLQSENQRVIISMPPRHGKTFLASILFPAFAFGVNPDLRIIACSYTADLAYNINGDVQKIMLNPKYKEVFPETQLFEKNVVTTIHPKRNKSEFEIVGREGKYVAAGVNGPITGKGADLLIIDDPIKNHQEAESLTYRNRTYKWYSSDAYSRLEKGANVILIQTRWHEDDLAGRLIANQEIGGEQWTVINFAAIKEPSSNPFDDREVGVPLWPGKYDLDALNVIKHQMGSKYWASLYQQSPTQVEGNMFKRAWFVQRFKDRPPGTVNFYIDPAYTADEKNDPTGLIAGIVFKDVLYVVGCTAQRLIFPELVKFIPKWVKANGYSSSSRIYIEPKASGISVFQQIQRELPSLNVIKDKSPTDSKIARANMITVKCEAGKVLFPDSAEYWIEETINELCGFPTLKHDDRVDCLVGLINTTLGKKGRRKMHGKNM